MTLFTNCDPIRKILSPCQLRNINSGSFVIQSDEKSDVSRIKAMYNRLKAMVQYKEIQLIYHLLIGLLLFSACTSHQDQKGAESISDEGTRSISDELLSTEAQKHMHKKSFEELAADFENPSRVSWQKPDTLLEYLELYAGGLQGKTVAEIGAGTGYISFRLAQKADKVIAVDIDQRFLDYIEEHKSDWPLEVSNKVEIRLAEVDDPKLAKSEVDKIFIVNTYHHLSERIKYLNYIKDFTEYLIIIDYKKEEIPVGPPSDIKLSAEEVFSELYQAGYSSARIDKKVLPYQYVIVAQR